MRTLKVTILALLMMGAFALPAPSYAADEAFQRWCDQAYQAILNGEHDPAIRDAALGALNHVRNSVDLTPEEAQKFLDATIELFRAVTLLTVKNLMTAETAEAIPARPVRNTAPVSPAKNSAPMITAASYKLPPDKVLTTFDSPNGHEDVDPFTTKLVPWLAASGPWSYSPENPPPPQFRDQWSNYALAMPSLLPSGNYSFGRHGGGRTRLDDLLEGVRSGDMEQVAVHLGELSSSGEFKPPVAIYKDKGEDGNFYLIQNGNYQILPKRTQPHLEPTGEVVLYRGVGPHTTWPVSINRFPMPRRQKLDLYLGLRNWYTHSRPDMAFGTAFAGSGRSETNHLGNNIDGFIEFRAFAKRFLTEEEIDDGEKVFGYAPTHNHNRWYTTRDPAKFRFGPNVIAVRTSVRNVTFSSDWNSEQEFHLVDPLKITRDEGTTDGVRPEYFPLR